MAYFVFSVLNSGHMVPMDVPKIALDMITRFLHDKGFSHGNAMVGVSLVDVEDAARCEQNAAMKVSNIKRGGGRAVVPDEEILKRNSSAVGSKPFFSAGFGLLTYVTMTREGDSNRGVLIGILFCSVMSIAVFFCLRLQKFQRQTISRR